ncbi:helix-hairpin-helix domain-containing protein [Clostridium vincentii]|uniref:ComE operon protein 1 n=1 Tax=Clostridium vincentii TaxID=52704 RepID=A0A2T0BEU6_9CLOT|nr:helix-hairpin-helix domain-containing protein [Clostridium vincentii]PRR82388.1 ComE operon protein 1 [Clostridium vincentii]
MKKNYKTIGIVVLLIILGSYMLFSYLTGGQKELKKNDNESIFVEDEIKEVVAIEDNKIVVEIKGEIMNPNIYWLKEESIIEDLISEAGGLKPDADMNKINRAEKLKNHQSINIANKNEVKQVVANESNEDVSPIIDINTASEAELDTLPGIGPARAKDIISYREEKGGFESIEDIKNIKGIGEASFEKLKDKITI